MDRLKRAEELRKRADELEKEHYRPLPEKWEIGMKVRYIRTEEWAFTKGQEATIVELRDDYNNKKANEYQVFYTAPDSGYGIFWTTPDDVEWIKE